MEMTCLVDEKEFLSYLNYRKQLCLLTKDLKTALKILQKV